MSPADAAAVASICACLLGVVNTIGQVYLGRKAASTHNLVDGMAKRNVRRARAEGVASATSKPPPPGMSMSGTPIIPPTQYKPLG